MKITEKQMREFFPANMRFLHFVAKKYGYSFYNDEAVRKANYFASIAITKIYNKGMEFESNEHLYGYVMNAMRYAILSSYHVAKKDSLEVRTESELVYGDSDDEYNVYLNSAKSNDISYDNTVEEIYQRLSNRLSPLDRHILHLKFKEDFRNAEIAGHLDVSDLEVRKSIKRIQTRYNRVKKELEKEGNEQREKNGNTYTSAERTKLRIQELVRTEPDDRVKTNEHSYTETMSWLYSKP